MAIAQYTRDGCLVNVFISMKRAAKETGVPLTSIHNCVTNKVKHGGGFVWIRHSEDQKIESTIPKKLEYHEEYPEFAIDDAWERLCFAIVTQAVEDYKLALEKNNREEIDDILDFFYSEFVEVTTGLNPDELVYQIERIHKKETEAL